MAYTNVNIEQRPHERETFAVLNAKLLFWQTEAERLADVLRNIPEAVRKYGHVDIIEGSTSMRLVADPTRESDSE